MAYPTPQTCAPSPSPDGIVNVLVVEDDASALDAMSSSLSGFGIRVRCAQGISEATAKLRHTPCEVTAVSLRLPGRGALSMLNHVQRTHPDIEVLLIASPGDESAAQEAIAQGAFAVVSRPFTPDWLAANIFAAQRQASLRRQRAASASPSVPMTPTETSASSQPKR